MTVETGISLERAAELIRASVKPVDVERIPACEALGRVLAEDIHAPIDQPPFPRSPLDGYAFRAVDSAGASRETPVCLTVCGVLYAGDWREEEVPAGQAVRIMTGAPIPPGCDCVIRQEDTDEGAETVQIYCELKPWENYCFRGEDYKAGDVLLPAGGHLGGAGMGVLASAGLCRAGVTAAVRRKLKVALLCTGDELVESEVNPLPKGKIYSSNQVLLESRLRELGVEVVSLSAEDDPERVADAIREAAGHVDTMITTGGVSVGAKDIFHQVFPLLDAERVFWRVRLKPGTPLMFSIYNGTPILSLSGNPFAAAATFELLGRPLLAALAGKPALLPQRVKAELGTAFPKGGNVRRFVRGCLTDGVVTLPEGHSSGQLRSTVGTNCLVELEAGRGPVKAGETVTVHIL